MKSDVAAKDLSPQEFDHVRYGPQPLRRTPALGTAAGSPARPRRNPAECRGLRRLPHRSPRARRRIADGRGCRSFPATKSSAASTLARRFSGFAPANGSAFPGSAGPAGRAPLPSGARKPLRPPGIHGLHPRRRLRQRASPTRASPFRSARRETSPLAPLLCAGLIGWRAFRSPAQAGESRPVRLRRRAHILAQMAREAGPSRVTPSPNPAIRRARRLPKVWAPFGPAARTNRRRNNSTPPSSSRRSARWFPLRSRACARAGRWSAPAST